MMRSALFVLLAVIVVARLEAQREAGTPQLDRSKPVAPKSEILKAWRARQDTIRSFQFTWTEQQTYPNGWLSNPRHPERERDAIPALLRDRSYTVSKTLAVDGNRMRYSFEIDRAAEPDGNQIVAEGGDNTGLGVRRHYSYISVFDGQTGTVRLSDLTSSEPPVIRQTPANVDAQNLDARAIMMALRPLDPVMGHALIDRAVTNRMRIFYKGRSTMLLEEQHDPSGWKMLLWIEPERSFVVSRYIVLFEQKIVVDIDIDYVEDARWGWIPSAWRVTEKLADGSRRLVTQATVSSYRINEPIATVEFR